MFCPHPSKTALFTKKIVNNEDWIFRYPLLDLFKTTARFSDVEEAFHL